jgi:hypothetical protein
MHAVSKQFVLPADPGRYLNGLQFFVRKVYDLFASHANDVMMLGCHWIVSYGLVQGGQARDDAVQLERVECLVYCRVRNGRVACSDTTKNGIRTWVRLVPHESLVYRQSLGRHIQPHSFALAHEGIDPLLFYLFVQSDSYTFLLCEDNIDFLHGQVDRFLGQDLRSASSYEISPRRYPRRDARMSPDLDLSGQRQRAPQIRGRFTA